MPRILAIDWDRLEARAVLLHTGPTGTSIAGAWVAPLATAENASGGPAIGERLAEAIERGSLGGATTLVGIGREQVQIVQLSLPPAPPEELPDLVRFQAERELTSLGADAALDFIPLTGDSTTPHQVLAAALAREGLAEARELCKSIGAEPDRITLRATAAASFVSRGLPAGSEGISLVANPLSDEADLVVLVGDQVVLVRTVRLPDAAASDARQKTLASEIRRTIAAVRQQLGDRQVGHVALCGTASDASLASTLGATLKLPVEVFDVVENGPSGLAKVGVPAGSLGRFAATFGMALREADRKPPVVDFLNVRRRVTAAKFTREHALAAVAAAVVLLAVVVFLWQRSASLSREIAELDRQSAELERQFEDQQLGTMLRQMESIDAWLATDVNWLDELDRLSIQWRPEPLDAKKFPMADDAVVTQLTAFRPPGNAVSGGRLAVQAVARNQAALAKLEQRLRDAEHRVSTGGGKQDSSTPGYGWSFGLVMEVAPENGAAAEDTP